MSPKKLDRRDQIPTTYEILPKLLVSNPVRLSGSNLRKLARPLRVSLVRNSAIVQDDVTGGFDLQVFGEERSENLVQIFLPIPVGRHRQAKSLTSLLRPPTSALPESVEKILHYAYHEDD
jgi:hypothetical protein